MPGMPADGARRDWQERPTVRCRAARDRVPAWECVAGPTAAAHRQGALRHQHLHEDIQQQRETGHIARPVSDWKKLEPATYVTASSVSSVAWPFGTWLRSQEWGPIKRSKRLEW